MSRSQYAFIIKYDIINYYYSTIRFLFFPRHFYFKASVLLQDDSDTDFLSIKSPPESRRPETSTATSEIDEQYSELMVTSPAPHNPRLNISGPPRRLCSGKREREVDNVITSVGKRLTEMSETKMLEDRHDVFGRSLAHKLRILPNEQRIYLEKLINEAVFEAELGNLTRNCSIHIPTIQQPRQNMVPQNSERNNLCGNSQGGYITHNNTNVSGYIDLDTPQNINSFLSNFKP